VGSGLAAVEIGKAMGARVIAAASSADKLAVAKAAGADELIDYSQASLKDESSA
jgi:NADPH2:quinone reductase